MLKTVCYKSSINKVLTILETEHLFDSCKKNNDNLNIKGLLYKFDNYYFQIIEGHQQVVDDLYASIKRDSRHKEVKVLLSQEIKKLTFNNFTTGYSKVEDIETIFGLQEYHHLIEISNFKEKEEFLEIISNLFSVKL